MDQVDSSTMARLKATACRVPIILSIRSLGSYESQNVNKISAVHDHRKTNMSLFALLQEKLCLNNNIYLLCIVLKTLNAHEMSNLIKQTQCKSSLE